LIESGKKDAPETQLLLERLLEPMLLEKIDYIVLGCSHYPYLVPLLKKILPADVQIIDSGEAVARQTKMVLMQRNLLAGKNTSGDRKPQFYTNADPDILSDLIKASENDYSVSYLDF
ncbi:MAG: glutamate racemase, partial [Salegentibacter sp.]